MSESVTLLRVLPEPTPFSNCMLPCLPADPGLSLLLPQRELPRACRDAYRIYLSQDFQYLQVYAQAYSSAIDQAVQHPEARSTLQELLTGVQEEQRRQTEYLQAGPTCFDPTAKFLSL